MAGKNMPGSVASTPGGDGLVAGGNRDQIQYTTDLPAAQLAQAAIVTLPRTVWTAQELLAAVFPEPRWAVPGLIPVGLTLLAGRPKLGKSWLALQISTAVGSGGRVFDVVVDRGNVLFLALEDSPRRLQARLAAQHAPATATVTFHTTWKSFGDGGFVDLQAELERVDYRLCVVDTFSRAAGRADQSDPAEMTAIFGELQALAMGRDMAILLLDHHRKGASLSQSPIDDIMSSTAKAAVADCAMGLYREQGKRETILKVIGRDVEERELSLGFDPLTSCWQSLGNTDDVRRDSLRGSILEAIRDLTTLGEATTTRRLALYLDKSDSHISRELTELLASGKVIRGAKAGREIPYLLARDVR